MKRKKKARYMNCGYRVGGNRIAIQQVVTFPTGEVVTALVIKVDGEYRKATTQEFVDHVNGKAAEAREEYLRSLEEDE